MQWKNWRSWRMRRPWRREGEEDEAIAIDLRKEMDARCVDTRLNKRLKGI
jgi:hypothetical protein